MKKDKAKKVESKKVFGSENSHNLFEYMNEGVCLHKIIYGEKEKPIDYKILDVNPAYEKIIGIKKEDVQNQIASDLYGTGEAPFLDIYSRVTETGNPESFEIFWSPLQKHFLISVFSPSKGHFATIFTDITNQKNSEEQIRIREKYLSTTLNSIGDAVITTDNQGKIAHMNPVAENLTEWKLSNAKDEKLTKVFNIVNGKTRAVVKNPVNKVIQFGKTVGLANDTILISRNNKEYFIDDSAAPIKNDEGDIVGVILIFRDITEKYRIQDKVRKSEEKYRHLFETMMDAYALIDLKGNILETNNSFNKMIGYTSEELRGFTVKDITPEKWYPFESNIIKQVLDQGYSDVYEKEYICKNGTIIPIELRTFLLKDKNGEATGMWAIIRDISGRKKSEQKLFEMESYQRALLDAVPDSLFLVKPDGTIVFSNDGLLKNMEISASDLDGKNPSKLMPEEIAAGRKVIVDKVINSGKPAIYKDTRVGKDIESRIFPIKDTQDKVTHLAIFARDITEQRLAEEAIKENEQQLDAIYQNAPFIMMLIDDERKIRRVNKFATDFSKRMKNEIIGMKSGDALRCVNSLDDPRGCGFGVACANCKIKQTVLDTLKTGKSHSLEQTMLPFNIDGKKHELTFLLSTTKIDFRGESLALVTILDITELKKAESELHRLGSAIEQAYDGVVITEPNGAITYVNPAFEKVTGYSSTEAIGQNPRFLKSGRQDDAFYKTLWETILQGERWKGVIVNKRKNNSFYTAECTISPVINQEGNIINFVWITRDISEQVKIQERLNQAQKMETIGTLAGGIAHDFNNILSPIMLHTEMLMADFPEGNDTHKSLDQIFIASKRARDLVQQILTFSRQTKQELHPLKVGVIIKEVMKLLRSTVPTTIDVEYNISTNSDTVFADPVQIHQLIMNLCTNSVHAMKDDGGELVITLSDVELTPKLLISQPALTLNKKYLKIHIRDTGEGIDTEIKDRIFDPFFTTKGKGEGTGMGLSVVHGIIESYQGSISLESEPGKGTIFEILLPKAKIEADEEVPVQEIPPTGNERILFVDDEKIMVDAVEQMLKKLGYQVTPRTSSIEALEVFKTNPNLFDLVITDMTMPNMRGDQLAFEIMKIRKDMPIIICTGFSEKINKKTAGNLGISALMMKPIVRSEMAKIIRDVLDKK